MSKGRPVLLTPELKRHIAAIISRNKKKWTVVSLRDELRIFLHHKVKEEVKTNGLDWEEKLIRSEVARRLPGESAIQKFIKREIEVTQNSPEFQVKEQLWSLGLLSQKDFPRDQYPELTAEAIRYIVDVQKWAEKAEIERIIANKRYGITFRQALWIARLYALVRKYKGKDDKDLWLVSYTYCVYEVLCELSKTPFDTWEFDRALRKGNFGLVTWNILGVGDEKYEAFYKLHTASQPIQPHEIKSIKELAEESKRRLKQSEAEFERTVKNERTHNTTE